MTIWRRRYGAYDPYKLETNLKLKDYFEQKMGMDIYEAVNKDHFVVEEDK